MSCARLAVRRWRGADRCTFQPEGILHHAEGHKGAPSVRIGTALSRGCRRFGRGVPCCPGRLCTFLCVAPSANRRRAPTDAGPFAFLGVPLRDTIRCNAAIHPFASIASVGPPRCIASAERISHHAEGHKGAWRIERVAAIRMASGDVSQPPTRTYRYGRRSERLPIPGTALAWGLRVRADAAKRRKP